MEQRETFRTYQGRLKKPPQQQQLSPMLSNEISFVGKTAAASGDCPLAPNITQPRHTLQNYREPIRAAASRGELGGRNKTASGDF